MNGQRRIVGGATTTLYIHVRSVTSSKQLSLQRRERGGEGQRFREREIVMQGLLEFRKRKRFRERKKIKRMGEKKSYYVRGVELDKFILEKIL